MSIKCTVNEVMAMDGLIGELIRPIGPNGQLMNPQEVKPGTPVTYQRLPIQATFLLSLMAKSLIPTITTFSEQRQALVGEYAIQAVPDPNAAPGAPPPQAQIPAARLPELNAKIQELAKVEVTVESEPIPLSVFGNYEIPLAVMMACTAFFRQ